jgi:hypothetical protein
MIPFTSLSRRAVVASAAMLAAAPRAGAKKKRKPKSKPEPLAFVVIAITGAFYNDNLDSFVWTFQAVLRHPSSDFTKDLSGQTAGPEDLLPEEWRPYIVNLMRSAALAELTATGRAVPGDRIAVTLM